MKVIVKCLQVSIFLLGLISLSGCNLFSKTIVRHQLNSWEPEIGYSQIVKHGNLYYFSGVTCGGATDEAALPMCYQAIDEMLKKMHLTRKNIIKETIYARDIEALKKQIPVRKQWYGEHFPAATWVQVDRLYDESHRFEVEMIVAE